MTQPYMQIVRPYTPLPPFANPDADADGEGIRLYVRREKNGEMSSFLHRLPQGAELDLRVSKQSYTIPDDVEEVLFLAGGTGIAPALQAAHGLLRHERKLEEPVGRPKMTVLWANRRREDCEGADTADSTANRSWWPLSWWKKSTVILSSPGSTAGRAQSPIVQELVFLQTEHAGRFKVQYFIDEEDRCITPNVLSSCLASERSQHEAASGRKLVLISGPDGFVEHFAGAKLWRNGRETQGPLRGVLSQLKAHGWDVHKL